MDFWGCPECVGALGPRPASPGRVAGKNLTSDLKRAGSRGNAPTDPSARLRGGCCDPPPLPPPTLPSRPSSVRRGPAGKVGGGPGGRREGHGRNNGEGASSTSLHAPPPSEFQGGGICGPDVTPAGEQHQRDLLAVGRGGWGRGHGGSGAGAAGERASLCLPRDAANLLGGKLVQPPPPREQAAGSRS